MKIKYILSLMLCCIFYSEIQAQVIEPRSLAFQLVIGPNLTIPDKAMKPYTGKAGIFYGLNINYGLQNNFIIQAGLKYEKFNFSLEDLIFPDMIDPLTGRTSGPAYIDYHFSYFEIPVEVKFVPGARKLRFLASLGLSPSILLAATQKAGVVGGGYESDIEIINMRPDVSEYYKSYNLSPFLGIGGIYQINKQLGVSAELVFNKVSDAGSAIELNFGLTYWFK